MRAILAASARDMRGRCDGRARIESTLAAARRRHARVDQDRPDAVGRRRADGRGPRRGRLGAARAELRRLPRRRSSPARRRRPTAAVAAQAGPGPRATRSRCARSGDAHLRLLPPPRSAGPEPDQGGSSCHRSHSPSTAPAGRRTSSRGRCSSDFLREGLGLTGTKVGCDTSQCGVLHRPPRRRRREVVHRARRAGRRRHGRHDRGPRRRTASCTRCRRRSGSSTASSAASARRG